MILLYRLVFAASTLLLPLAAAGQDTPPQPRPALPSAAPAPVPAPPTLNAKSWVLMDYATGQVLLESAANLSVEPASITKIMTSYVVSAELAQGNIGLDDQVLISENAWRGGGAGTDGSTSFLELNSHVPLKDLMYGMIIQSGNDAAIALAEHVAGSEETFVQLMNQYGRQLGLSATHYRDASGLPHPEHVTTARDVAILSRALIHDFPEDYKIYAIKDFEWNGIRQHNRNTLLWRDATVDGIKTGHTRAAGYCLATSALRDGQRLIAVVMGADSEKQRADDSQALLNYGFRFFEAHTLYEAGASVATPKLWKGSIDELPLGLTEDLSVTMQRGRYDDLKASINIPAQLSAPFAKGEKVGSLVLSLDGETLLERPLVALVDAPEGSFFKRMVDSAMLWFHDDSSAEAEKP